MKLRGPALSLLLCLIGVPLGLSAMMVMPLGHAVSGFWLPIIVVVNGSILFGGWGLVAAAIFPVISSVLLHALPGHTLSIMLPNILEGLIPAIAFRFFRADPCLQDRTSLKIYLLWAAVIPSVVGGLMAAWLWVLLGDSDWPTSRVLSFDWALSNSLVLIMLGFPVIYLFTPILRKWNLLVPGWWQFAPWPTISAESTFLILPERD